MRSGEYGLDLTEPLSKDLFTIIAHEIGHRIDFQSTNQEEQQEFTYDEKKEEHG